MTDKKKVKRTLEEHGHAHARDRDEGSIEKRQESAYRSLQHTPPRSRRVEVDCDCGHHMFPVLMTEQRSNGGNERRQRTQ